MGRILRMLISGLLHFCLATIIAEVLLGAYFAGTWHVDRNRLIQMLAAAQGVDLAALQPKAAAAPTGENTGEQASFDQIVEARAIKIRDLELREQALKNDLEQLRVERGKVAEEKTAFQKIRTAFEAQVAGEKRRETDAGWEENRRTLLAAKPKQAKALIMEMLEKNEMDDVVALMRSMDDKRRAKIFAEFKPPDANNKSTDEIKKVDEILRLIRRGEPVSSAADKVQQQLGPAAPANPPGAQ